MAGGQPANIPDNIASGGVLPNLRYRLLDKLVQADGGLVRFGPPDSGKGEEVVDEVPHALGSFHNHRHVTLALRAQTCARSLVQELREPGHMAQRRAEVVGYGIGERFELLVAGLELDGTLSKFFVERPNFLLATLPLRDVIVVFHDRTGPLPVIPPQRPSARHSYPPPPRP